MAGRQGFRMILTSLKSNMQYVAALGTAGLYVAIIYPHQWGLKRYMQVLQMYKNGEPLSVDADSKRIGQQILDKVRWDPVSEANVEFFSAYGQDIVHRGSTFTKYGGIIGIPINFVYRSVDDIDKEKITISNKPIDWNTPAGHSLQESLVLSEKARKFAIARELFYVHTHYIHLLGLFAGGSAFIAYWLGFAVNRLNRLPQRTTLPVRIILYGFFTGLGATLYCLASDTYSWYRDRKVDRQACKLGEEYAEGGTEFYTKLLERNIALRTLMGPDGPRRYTAYGNDVHFWRSPSVPLTSRRDLLVELSKQQECSSHTTPAAEPA